jgi:hypothetical protein
LRKVADGAAHADIAVRETTMHHPDFFDLVPRLRLRDALADFLGAAREGVLEYGYPDAVKLAGHSCPTVAGAYGLTRRALTLLYGTELPERGGIRVEFREARTVGVTGVIANVVSLLTGAAGDGGFKGLGGHFARRDLLVFGVELPLDVRFTRLDTGARIDGRTHLQRLPSDPAMAELLQRCLSGEATPQEAERFGDLWQDRVRRILLDHGDDPQVFELRPAG